MKFSSLTDRIAVGGTNAWEIHNRAMQRSERGEDIILLSIGQESDEVTGPDIVASACKSLQQGRHHYTQSEGLPALRESIARYHTQMTGQVVSSENCTVHTGAQNALFSVAQCLLEHGDEVIVPEPYYTTYPATFSASGATLLRVPVQAGLDYLPDPADIINAITPNTKVIVLNSPSNPLGAVYTQEQYKPIVEACLAQDIWLVSDEVYSALLEKSRRFSPASIAGADRVCITISSLSKSHRMTGWRIGWAVAPTELTRHLSNLSMCMHYGLAPFIMDAAITALERNDTADVIRQSMQERRGVIKAHLKVDSTSNQPVRLHDSGAGMFVLLNVENTGMTAKEFAAGLLERHAVSTLPCDGFGPSGRYLLRVGLCVESTQLKVACERINTYLDELNLTSG